MSVNNTTDTILPPRSLPHRACARVFHCKEDFKKHLKKHHRITTKADIEEKEKACHIGRDGQGAFWCGFCEKILPLVQKGIEAWDEKFDHIDNRHYKEKMEIASWREMNGKLKGDKVGDGGEVEKEARKKAKVKGVDDLENHEDVDVEDSEVDIHNDDDSDDDHEGDKRDDRRQEAGPIYPDITTDDEDLQRQQQQQQQQQHQRQRELSLISSQIYPEHILGANMTNLMRSCSPTDKPFEIKISEEGNQSPRVAPREDAQRLSLVPFSLSRAEGLGQQRKRPPRPAITTTTSTSKKKIRHWYCVCNLYSLLFLLSLLCNTLTGATLYELTHLDPKQCHCFDGPSSCGRAKTCISCRHPRCDVCDDFSAKRGGEAC